MRSFALAVFYSTIFLSIAACSDDSDSGKRPADPVGTYNTVARDSAEAECACIAESGLGGGDECFDDRFEPLVLSSCEKEAVRCEANNFELYLACRTSAQLAFQSCIDGCPSGLSDCRVVLEDALVDCDESRSEALLAHFQTCRDGGSPVCSDPRFAGSDAGGSDAGGNDAGGPDDAGMQDDMGMTENRAPTANAGADQSVQPGVTATLQGSGTDPDGDTLSYAWEIVEQPPQSTPVLTNEDRANATLTATVQGEYTVELTVDDGSLTDTDRVTVDVTQTDQPPTAVATGPGVVDLLTPVILDARGSSDDVDSQSALSFAWSFVTDPSGGSDNISNANSPTASFVPSALGTYVIQARVTDSAGNSDTANVSVAVIDGPCVIISEYIEGAGENRALELFNCGSTSVDLSKVGYCSEPNADSIVVDGCNVQTRFSGTLAPGDVHVFCHNNFGTPALCDQTYFGVSFTGDDRVVIFYDDDGDGTFVYGTDSILDVLGQLGVRPSDPTIWQDKGLRRCNLTPVDGMSAFNHLDYYDEVAATALDDLGDPPTQTCPP